MKDLIFDIQRFTPPIPLATGETYSLGGLTYTALATSELQLDETGLKFTGLTSGKVRAVVTGVVNSPTLNLDATNGALTFSASGNDKILTFNADNVTEIFDDELNMTEGAISISRDTSDATRQLISVTSGTKIFSTQNNLTLNLTVNDNSNFRLWKNARGVIHLQLLGTSTNFTATAIQNDKTIFSGDIIFGGALTYLDEQKTLGLVDSSEYNIHNSFVTLTVGDYTLRLATSGSTTFAAVNVSDDGEITFNYIDENYNTAQVTFSNGSKTILQKTISVVGAFSVNPTTQAITLKKDTALTLTQGTEIWQVVAQDDAGGVVSILDGKISFTPNENNGAISLNIKKGNTEIFDGNLTVTDGTISFDAATQKFFFTKGTKISAATGENNQFVIDAEITDADAGFKIESDSSGNYTITPDKNDAAINVSLKSGDTTIFQNTISISGALVVNPTTQAVTLKKDTVLTLTQGTKTLQITALADAGGKFNITSDSISFKPNSNDGALELNFVNLNRKATVNVTGGFTLKDGKFTLDRNTTIDLTWDDGNKLKIKSTGSTVTLALDDEMGVRVVSEDESISMELTTVFGYTNSISAFKGSLWYNAGKVTFDANSKITAKGTLNRRTVDMTLETSGGDGYLDFGATGITYGAGTGKMKVTIARDKLESTIAVNEGSMIIGHNLFTINAGSSIETDLKTLIPSLNFTTADAGDYTINGQKITTTAANLPMTATDNQMVFKTSDDKILYEGMSFAGSGGVTLTPAEVKLGSGVVATGFGEENSFVLTEKGNVTVDSKIFEMAESVSSGLTVKGSEDGFTFSRTITEESEKRSGVKNSPDIGKIFTENFTAKGDKSYRISADMLGLEEIIGISNGATIDGSAIFDGAPTYHYFNLVTDSAGRFTIGKHTYTIRGDNNVAIRARFNNGIGYAGYFESLTGSVVGDFSAGNFHINKSGEMQVLGDTEIEISADDKNLKISGLDFNASLQVESSGEYVVNSTTIEAAAGDAIVGTYDGYARLYNKNYQENILPDTVMTATYNDNTLINTGDNVKINAKSGRDSITNYGDKVTINAASSADTIHNYGNDTRILGGAGDDYISNEGNKVYIDAGSGADQVYNHGSDTTIIGGSGNELILNYGEKSYINAGSGNDVVINSGANATITGLAGADSISNAAKNVSINTGSGNDTIFNSYNAASSTIIAGAGADYISNNGENVTIIGGAGNDTVWNNGKNILYQYGNGDGKDSIFGFTANDTLQITKGTIKNTLFSGDDFVLQVGSGSITLKDIPMGTSFTLINAKGVNSIMTVPKIVLGTTKADSLDNKKDEYKIDALGGNDTISNYGDNVTIVGGKGNDEITNSGKNIFYQYANGDGKDTITGFGENGTLQITKGKIKNTLVSGDDFIVQVGSGSITLKDMPGGTSFNLINADGTNEVVTVPKLVLGTSKAESLNNNRNEYKIDALGGNDSISNSSDNVTIVGGKGADSIKNTGKNILYQYASGDGNDTIEGFGESDTLQVTKGALKSASVQGYDVTFKISSGSVTLKDAVNKNINLMDAKGNVTSSIFSGVWNGTYNADFLENVNDDFSINALGGNDTITNSGNNVTIIGGRGNDSIRNTGRNVLYRYASGDGNDTIVGFRATDTLEITKGAVKSTTIEGGDTIIKVSSGSITLKNFSGTANILTANSKTLDLLYDDNFITDDFTLDEITEQKFEVQNIETQNNSKITEQPLLTFADEK